MWTSQSETMMYPAMSLGAAAKVVDMPEVLDLVLSYVQERHSLAQCIRVNHFWHSLAVKHLWQGDLSTEFEGVRSVPMSALAVLLQNVDRFKYYARQIRHLDLLHEARTYYATNAQLRKLYQKYCDQLTNVELWESSPLEALNLYYGSLPWAENHHITTQSPVPWSHLRLLHVRRNMTLNFMQALKAIRPRWLSISIDFRDITDEALLGLVAVQQDLIGLQLKCHKASDVDYRNSIVSISKLPRLRHFTLDMEDDHLPQAHSTESISFAIIQSLCTVRSCFTKMLVFRIEELASLRVLNLSAGDRDEFDQPAPRLNLMLRKLSHISTLEDVRINNYMVVPHDIGEALHAFAVSNTLLQILNINSDRQVTDASTAVIDASDIEDLARSCPRLKRFVYDHYINGNTMQLVASLVNLLPDLLALGLTRMTFDFQKLNQLSPIEVRPPLQGLKFGTMQWQRLSRDNTDQREVQNLLMFYFPHLTTLLSRGHEPRKLIYQLLRYDRKLYQYSRMVGNTSIVEDIRRDALK